MAANKADFQRASAQGRSTLISEFIGFLMENRNWWLVPILLVLGLVALLVLLSGSGAAPFIYTMF
jgi:hypothetical protein